MLYPQCGDSFVTIDSVTSLHSMCRISVVNFQVLNRSQNYIIFNVRTIVLAFEKSIFDPPCIIWCPAMNGVGSTEPSETRATSSTDQPELLHSASAVHRLVPWSWNSSVWCAGRMWNAAGKVTVGLASHWPCVTEYLSDLSTYGLTA